MCRWVLPYKRISCDVRRPDKLLLTVFYKVVRVQYLVLVAGYVSTVCVSSWHANLWKMKESLLVQSSLPPITLVKKMISVSIAYSFSWIQGCGGDTRIRQPQRCIPERRSHPFINGSCAGD
ncbi:hypothetical protein TNCT_438851 [Trichonephila clavata]|uniref:Uncharacterized protein n=1 Tax=Trichonephila clavata TaxID=2740835 RepID=A0A8X6GXF7_TRICU|nr:hypothetical protein TNCT_438851 [Trichonephila clavata]